MLLSNKRGGVESFSWWVRGLGALMLLLLIHILYITRQPVLYASCLDMHAVTTATL